MENSIISPEFLLPALNSDDSDISDLFRTGMTVYRHRDYSGAVNTFQNILNINPELPEAHVNLGNSYFNLNKIPEAIECWKKALTIDPNQVSCYLNIGNANYITDNMTEAVKNWLTVVTMAPDHTTANYNLGSAYERMGDIPEAFRYYERYLKYHEKDRSSDYRRIYVKVTKSKEIALHNMEAGFYYQKRNKIRKATVCYLKSIKSYPNFVKAHLNMGSICYNAEKYEHAAKYWRQALKLDPAYEETFCNLGIIYDLLKKYDLAYCMYKRYNTVSGRELFQVEERLNTLKSYLEKHPEFIRLRLEKAEDFFAKQKFIDSLWEYENYLALKPDQAGSLESRINEIRNYINPDINASIVAYEIGNKCYSQGKYDKAAQAYRRYLLLNPEGEYKSTVHQKISACAKQLGKSINAPGR